jgi:outer membrane lipoprotein-sorting protein
MERAYEVIGVMFDRNAHNLSALILGVICFGLLFLLPVSNAAAGDLTAEDILNKVDDLYRGDSSMGKMTMEIITENWSRTLVADFWTLGKENSMVRILSPKKEKGMGTLRVGNDIWNYLPKVNRTIKVPSSMMSQSWMGSHFTNDDIVHESRMADDYEFEITFEGERDDQDVIEITCIPKPDAAIVWGKLIITVRSSDYVPLEMAYYDEDLGLARTFGFSNMELVDGQEIPMTLTVIPADKPDETTIVTYEGIQFDVDIGDDVFTLRNLQS